MCHIKKIYLIILFFAVNLSCFSQVANYVFSQSNSTYQEISGTAIWTATTNTAAGNFDTQQANVSVPFTFVFNGTNFTTVNVNSNGSVIFPGSTATSTTTTPISGNVNYLGAVAAWGRDIVGAFDANFVSSVSYATIGTAPNRTFVVQYKNVRPVNTTSATSINLINFQIHLQETSNIIKIVYGANSTFIGNTISSSTAEIGLRGTSNADYNNRLNTSSVLFTNSTLGIANSSSQAFSTDASSIQKMPTNGLTYTYTPPVPCTSVPNGGTVSAPSQIICNNTTPISITVLNPNYGIKGLTHQWEESDDNGVADTWTNVTGGSGATGFIYTPPFFSGATDKYYRLKITCTATGQSATSTVHRISSSSTILPVSNFHSSAITDYSIVLNWEKGNGTRRVILASGTNSFSTLPASGAGFVNGTPLVGSDLILYDTTGTGTNVTVTGINCMPVVYFRMYEYTRCGTSPNYIYTYATPVDLQVIPANFQTNAVAMPVNINFTGYNGSNLSIIRPLWEERFGDAPAMNVEDIEWESTNVFSGITTAKINMYSDSKKDWIISPSVEPTVASILRFKVAITEYGNIDADPDGMQNTDDKIEVFISSATCTSALGWELLHTFNAASTINLTNILTEYIFHIPNKFIGQKIRIGFKASEGSLDNPDYDFHISEINIEATPPPTVTTSKIDILCHGASTGSASALVTDGIAPFTYSWSPIGGTSALASNLPAGTYVVTVTDALNRSDSETVTILQSALIQSNGFVTNVGCNGANDASIILATSGGILPYSYLWSDSSTVSDRTSLSAGAYSVTITDGNNCSVTENFVIIEPEVVHPPAVFTQTYCIAENKKVGDLLANESDVKWYASATSTTLLDVTEILETKSYFATQTVNGCESTTRAEVGVTIHNTPAPTAQNQEFCIADNSTIADLVATGQNIKWYDTTTSTTELATTTVLTSGSYFASQTVNNCESVDRTEVVVTIQDTPTPTAVDQEFCIAENSTIADLIATGTDIKWYDSVTSTTALNTNVALVNGASYFSSQTENGCESVNRTEVVVTIQDTAAPTSQNQEFCIAENATIVDLVAIGQNIKWYNSATSTTALATTTILTSGSYFASQTVNGCESVNRTEVVVTIQDTAAPTAVDQEFCIAENATIADLDATGQNIKWYETATSTTELATTTVLSSGSYFASQTENNCESLTRAEVIVTIHNTATPTAQNQEFCISDNATIADLVVTGTNIRWYETATSSTELATTTILTSGSYFASQTENSCESVNRAEVVVTIQDTAAPTTTSIQEFCSNENSKISDLVITGTDIRWYASETSTTELNTNTSLVNGVSYFATQTENGCESANRTEVQIQISTPPNLPSGDSIQTFCGNATIADLEIVGLPDAELIWYQTSYSNTILPTSTALANATYYVAQKVSACISDRKPVTARIINLSAPNVGEFEFCGSAVIADLYIPAPTGTTYKWYNSPSNADELEPNTALNTGTYFVSKNEYNCETQRTAVSVVINDLPDSPTGVSPQTFIEGSVLNQIMVNPTTAVYYITEEDARTGTNPLSPNMPLVNGTTYYAVVIGTNGCPSLPLPITVDVYLSNNEFEKDKLKYYPNPVKDKLQIEYFENIVQVDVYDLLGKKIKSINTNDRNVEIDLSELSTANYMIQLQTETKQQFIKIIKQ